MKPGEQPDVAKVIDLNQPCPESIVDVVIVVRDGISEIRELGLESGLCAIEEPLAHIAELSRILQRAMFEHAFATFEGQVEPRKFRVSLLELIDDAQRLQIVFETAVVAHAFVERVLACVTEWCVTEIVRKAYGFGQGFIDPKGPRDSPADLRDLQGMRDTGAVKIAFVIHEHLRLVDQPPERVGMDDSVAVALELGSMPGRWLGVTPAATLLIDRGE
jgi:hypothetical protein